MTKTKLFLTAALFVAAVGGAWASQSNRTETLYWLDGSTFKPIPTEKSCPNIGQGCTDLVPGHGEQQLYRFDGFNYNSLKVG